MLVYGDREEEVDPSLLLAELQQSDGAWLSHDALRDRFIALSGLAQGLADADFAACGLDRRRVNEEALLSALQLLGKVLLRSWNDGGTGGTAPFLPALANLPARVTVREAEGYAHYALYPEAYGAAALQLKLKAPPLVIGLRSIGSGLAAIAAAALSAPTPVTLRPCGDPFARSLRIDEELASELLAHNRHFVIVDEGPGLSGSSFGCVADWLEDHGVAADRIDFLPGHDGELGPQACERHRQRWSKAQRPAVKPDLLPSWIAGLIGPIERWQDISAGAWRPLWRAFEKDWPPVVPAWERTKFLVDAGGARWMVRFAGLGEAGQAKLALARLLAERGFGPEVAGLTHGWLVTRWHDDAQPSRPSVDELASYLALRSHLPGRQGASLEGLVSMARRNVPELAKWSPALDALKGEVRPVLIDGRLQPHEWLRLPYGRLLKADALDHHRAHDLVGAQDIGWDAAAAEVELGIETSIREPRLVAFYRVAYCAFQIGAHVLGEKMSRAEEAPRHEVALSRYRSALVDAVEHLRHVDQALGIGIKALA